MKRSWWRPLVLSFFAVQLSLTCVAQAPPAARTFSQPVPEVQSALKKLPGSTSGPLPTLEGFVTAGKAPLNQYSRAFYHYTVKVVSAPSGSRVSVSSRITAWHDDPVHPGYEMLPSNGRLESDLLDRLQDSLQRVPGQTAAMSADSAMNGTAQPALSAPMPQLPRASAAKGPAESAPDSALRQEARNLEDILRNQSHPGNLVAVKNDNTPILQNPSTDAKTLFLASAEDEFEILDVNPEWVHVRISGLSRGWLRRSSVDILGDSTGTDSAEPAPATHAADSVAKPAAPAASGPFSITGEEVGSFPGDWQVLQGKNVKIMTVQQTPGTGRITSPQEKLAFAKSLFEKLDVAALGSAAGVVVIFDSEDGGMVAVTRPALQDWKDGRLPDSDFWKQCFLDPPEILGNH